MVKLVKMNDHLIKTQFCTVGLCFASDLIFNQSFNE